MLIFLDMQTTGVEKEDVLCSIGILSEENLLSELINEGKKISSVASSVHNITNEMIADSPQFQESSVCKSLQQYNRVENTLVTHNITFHLHYLARAGFEWQGGVIDTSRVTKHLIPECEIFSLNFLRYELRLYKEEEKYRKLYGIGFALHPHEVKSGVIITKILFEYLNNIVTVATMSEMSFSKVLLEKLPFGKYKGKYIEEIMMCDKSYLHWMLQLPEIDEDLVYSLQYYLEG